MVNVVSRIEDIMNWILDLQDYLKSNTEFSPSDKVPLMPDEPQYTKVKITVTNSAPGELVPKIVFSGVGLSIAKLGGDVSSVVQDQINFRFNKYPLQNDAFLTEEERSVQILQKVNYIHMNGMEFPDITKEEQNSGETLFPGEYVCYEMDISNVDLPYFQFRLEGSVSYRYLFHHEVVLPVAESFTRPIIITAMQKYNNLDIHKVLKSLLVGMPEFGNDTKLSEIRRYINLLSDGEDELDKLQKEVNNLYLQHKLSVFQAHMQAAYNYLGHIKVAIENLRTAISSSVPETITAEVQNLQSINDEAIQIDKHTEALMTRYNLTDEDVDYKYMHW